MTIDAILLQEHQVGLEQKQNAYVVMGSEEYGSQQGGAGSHGPKEILLQKLMPWNCF